MLARREGYARAWSIISALRLQQDITFLELTSLALWDPALYLNERLPSSRRRKHDQDFVDSIGCHGDTEAAKALIKFLTGPEAAPRLKAKGFEPG
jgi:hypothetical protein